MIPKDKLKIGEVYKLGIFKQKNRWTKFEIIRLGFIPQITDNLFYIPKNQKNRTPTV